MMISDAPPGGVYYHSKDDQVVIARVSPDGMYCRLLFERDGSLFETQQLTAWVLTSMTYLGKFDEQ